jgi:hypothetical protein
MMNWKEVGVVHFKISAKHLPDRTDENQEKLQSG